VAYVYDVLNRVTQVEENWATSGPGLLASYAYDSLGRRSSLTRAGGAGASTGYAYDAASRLYTLTQTLAGSASVTYTLGYNAAGQVLTRQVSNSAYVAHPGSITAGYVANGLNQYTSATGITASYVAANSAALSYDPAGRLQSETTAGATTSFLYSGGALVGEYDSSGNILARYATGPGVDEPLLWYQGAGTTTRHWLTADNQGSVIGYADQSGNSGATYAYGPYGEPIVSGGGSGWGGSRYRFTGQIEIPEAQLYYYKARVYDPNLGRFYQTDPAGLASDVNLYAYATEDPVNASDPTGTNFGYTNNQPITAAFGGTDTLPADPLISDFLPDPLSTPTVAELVVNPASPSSPTDTFFGSFGSTAATSGGGGTEVAALDVIGHKPTRGNDRGGFITLTNPGSASPGISCPAGTVPVGALQTLGKAAADAGMPTVPKPGAIAGGGRSGPWTSPASGALRSMTGYARFGPLRPLTGTSSIGGSLGRTLPIWGVLLSSFDFVQTAKQIENQASGDCVPFA
jgi:RHS repeat-associated protein